MLKRFTLLFALVCSLTTVWGAYGIFQAGVIVGGTTYFDNSVPPSPNTFNGQNFSVQQGNMLNLSFAFVKTFKNGGSDVCGARVHYAVYPAGGAPSFIAQTLCFGSNLGNGDQEWNSTNCPFSVNLAAGLSPGMYKIEIFYSAPGGNCGAPVDAFLSNGGANYIANLTVTSVPLAVQLTAFDARRNETGVELTWQANAERDHAAYQVERRTATGEWAELGEVKARGTATAAASYTFTDARPSSGDNYYRLAMEDLQGKTTHSAVVRVDARYTSAWQLSPNPATEVLVLRFMENEAPANTLIRLYNAQGSLALQYNAGEGATSITVPLTSLAAGMYWLDIQSGDGMRTALQPVIKQ